MQQAFFSLIFITAHVSVTVDCRPGLQDPQLQQHQTRRFNTETDADTSAGTGRFYLELNGSMRKGLHRGLLGESACVQTKCFHCKLNNHFQLTIAF